MFSNFCLQQGITQNSTLSQTDGNGMAARRRTAAKDSYFLFYSGGPGIFPSESPVARVRGLACWRMAAKDNYSLLYFRRSQKFFSQRVRRATARWGLASGRMAYKDIYSLLYFRRYRLISNRKSSSGRAENKDNYSLFYSGGLAHFTQKVRRAGVQGPA